MLLTGHFMLLSIPGVLKQSKRKVIANISPVGGRCSDIKKKLAFNLTRYGNQEIGVNTEVNYRIIANIVVS